jgi:hypothetical protein
MAAASPDLIAPDELADMMESPDFAALPAFERAQMFDAGLEESRAWLKTNAGDDEKLSKAFDETANAMARRYRPAESDIQMSQAEADKPFFRLGDAASGVADAVSGLTTTLPAAYYRLTEGFQRPDKYSPEARAAFDEEAGYAKRMQDESTARLKRGEASSTGDAFRSVGPSLGFSVATMGAAVPAGMAGAKVGAAGGAAAGAGVGAFFAGVGAAPGAAIGGTVGGTVGGVGAGMAAAGTAAYRMAGAQFLDDAFQAWLAKNPKADEAAREEAYQQLLPLAQNSALWEAGPEAIGTVVGLGAGKVVLGLGKQTLTSLAKSALGKAGIKAGALAAGVGTELATETATQVGQGLPQAQAQKFAAGEAMSQAKNPYDVPGGTMQAFKDVAPQTLALSGLMLGAGGAVKGAASLGRNPTDQPVPVAMPASGQAVSPLGDIAAGTFVPEQTPQTAPAYNSEEAYQRARAAALAAAQPAAPVRRAPILGNVPDAVIQPAPVNTPAAVPEFNEPANIQEPVTVPDVQSGLNDAGAGLSPAAGSFTPASPARLVSTGKPNGAQVSVVIDYVEAAELEPLLLREVGEDQTRDRANNRASAEQIASIATSPDAQLLGDSPVSSLGAPVVDDVVLAGNGRAEGLLQGYRGGGSGIANYRAQVVQQAEAQGRPDVAGMKQPVMIRRVTNYVRGDRRSFVTESNPKYGALQETVAEASLLDAEVLGDMSGIEFTESGQLTSSSLQQVATKLKAAQRGVNATTGGKPDVVEASRRVQLASLAKLARDNGVDVAELSGLLETDTGRRTVAEVSKAAPRLAALDADLGLGDVLLSALRSFSEGARAVSQGVFKNLNAWAENRGQELIRDELSPEAGQILEIMIETARTPTKLRELFDSYLEAATNEQDQRNQAAESADIFGDARSNVAGKTIVRRQMAGATDGAPATAETGSEQGNGALGDARVPAADETSGLAGVQPAGAAVPGQEGQPQRLADPQTAPVLTSATLVRDTIFLEFDALANKPTREALQASFPGAMIEEMRPDVISGTQGNVQYRIIALNEKGNMSSQTAKDLYQKAFGTDKSIRGKTRFQQMGSLAERFQIGQKIAGMDDPLAQLGSRANDQAPGFKNTAIDRDLEAGFMSTAGVDALFDLANAAITAGKTFVQWSAEMVKRFGESIREYLAHVWAVAKDSLPTTAAQNVRLGGPAKAGPVRLNPSGAVINLIPALKGGTKVFHAKGEPFRVNYLGARELLTGSPLPAELVPVLTRTNQEKRSLEQKAAQLGRDLQSAIDAYVDKSGLPAETVNAQVAAMMGGDFQAGALLSVTAPVLHERTTAVRKLLDNLSAAVGQTLPVGDLRKTIMGNLGMWLRRSYAAFDPASGWNYDALLRAAAAGTLVNGKDAAKLLNEARVYLRAQNPQATTQQIESDLRDLMDRDVWERELTGSGARKSTSSLMQRKDIAPEIRAVMGEEQNPVKLLTSSAGFQAQFIARHHGQVAMRNAGLATGLFSNQRGGVFTEQIPVDGRQWSGFNGVWTTPQMLKALENASGVIKEGSDLGGIIVSTLKALGNKAKLNRVALNPDSWMVNMLGNFTSLIQNGDVFAWSIINRIQKAREITGAGDAKTGAVVNAAAEALQDASRDMQARLTEAGVLGTSLTLADLEASLPRHLLQWLALDQKADKAAGALEGLIVGQGIGRGLGLPGRAVGGAIGAAAGAVAGGTKIQAWQMKLADFLMTKPDALARVTGWMTNYETALASGMAPDAAATWASQRTLNTFPNYAALPGLFKEASKLGIMGSFIAFQHEVYRNFGWNVRYAAEELSSGNPALIQRGLQRVAGIGAIGAMAGGGLAALLAATGVAGGDDERNKLFRKWFGAPWEKDAVLAFREFDAEKVSYFNTSYLLPQTTMVELLQAMREGENPADSAGRVVDRLYEQFIGGSVHLGPLLGAAMNQKRSGAPLTYQTGVAGAAERLDEPLKTILEPGFAEKIERLTYAVRQAERNGTLYSIEQEFRRIIGLREQTKTWPKMVEGVYRNLAEENSNIRSQANREISLNRPGASKRAVDAANGQIEALRQKLADFERDALKLGVPESVIIRAKREANVGKLPSVGLQVDGKRVISLGK